MGAVVPDLNLEISGDERRIRLLQRAVEECLGNANIAHTEEVPLLVGLSEANRPGRSETLTQTIIEEIERRVGTRFHQGYSRVIPSGHTSGFEGLREARELLQRPGVQVCIVCAADSYIDSDSLFWLNKNWRLKTGRNSDGVIPGEAAAAIALRASLDKRSRLRTRIRGLGFGTEPAAIMTAEPLLGRGLTEATQAALAEAGIHIHEADFRVSDISGESYEFREQALAIARLYRVHRDEMPPLWHSAENIGDTGAVAGVIQLIMTVHAFNGGYAPGQIAMCFTSADSGARAVAVVALDRSASESDKA